MSIDTKQDQTVDHSLPLSALPPSAQPDIPDLLVLVTLRADTPMMNRVLVATKNNLNKENDGQYCCVPRNSALTQPSAGTAGESSELAVMLAEFKAMKKVSLHILNQ